MKYLALSIVILFHMLACKSKSDDFLISYTDESSGESLIGYKTPDGKIIINAKYPMAATDTMYKMAMVIKDNEWVGIDRNENVLLKPFIYDNGPDYVKEGLFRFVEDGKIGFADINGNKVIPAVFDFATPFENGVSEYTLGGYRERDASGEYWFWTGGYETGLIDNTGKKIESYPSDSKNK